MFLTPGTKLQVNEEEAVTDHVHSFDNNTNFYIPDIISNCFVKIDWCGSPKLKSTKTIFKKKSHITPSPKLCIIRKFQIEQHRSLQVQKVNARNTNRFWRARKSSISGKQKSRRLMANSSVNYRGDINIFLTWLDYIYIWKTRSKGDKNELEMNTVLKYFQLFKVGLDITWEDKLYVTLLSNICLYVVLQFTWADTDFLSDHFI